MVRAIILAATFLAPRVAENRHAEPMSRCQSREARLE